MKTSRRLFLSQSSAITAGFFGLDRYLSTSAIAETAGKPSFSYGELKSDPDGIIDLPEGFSYEVLSQTGRRMPDGYKVPGKPDGMAAFDLGGNRVALIRNHEIGHSGYTNGPFDDNKVLPEGFDESLIYDGGNHGGQPFVGGTSTIVYNLKTRKVEDEYLSLLGTDRNCAGGPTPWGTWITCEEPSDMTTQWGAIHGYCFEVPAAKKQGLTKPIPLKAMGRFRHEAVAVDPRTDIIYLTEDRNDGVIYRFLPKERKNPAAGGKLQALMIKGDKEADTRNWPGGERSFPIRKRVAVEWVDLDDVESPNDDLRLRAIDKGAVIFSRGEGMWYGSPDDVGEHSIYWACTDGGEKRFGQIFRYFPSEAEGTAGEADSPGELELYLEPNDSDLLKSGDNITIANSGHLYICEDTKPETFIRGVTKEGELFTFAKNALNSGEFAGACFSPDGETLFVNIQTPGITLAITGNFVS